MVECPSLYLMSHCQLLLFETFWQVVWTTSLPSFPLLVHLMQVMMPSLDDLHPLPHSVLFTCLMKNLILTFPTTASTVSPLSPFFPIALVLANLSLAAISCGGSNTSLIVESQMKTIKLSQEIFFLLFYSSMS